MRVVLLGLSLLSLVLMAPNPAVAGEAAAAAVESQQSIPPEAAVAAPAAHDHSGTCGGGGSCCASCQMKQKYAKNPAADGEGGCPCQKAKRAREQAAREPAAREQAAGAAD